MKTETVGGREPRPETNEIACEVCGREFQSPFALYGHKRTHSREADGQSRTREPVGRPEPVVRREGEAEFRLVPRAQPSPLFGKETGLSVWYAPFKPDGLDQLEEATLRYGATAGTFYAEDSRLGTVVSFPAGSSIAAQVTLSLAGTEEGEEDADSDRDAEEEDEPTLTEEEAISEAAKLLPHDPLLETREEYVLDRLTAARKKAKARPEWTDDAVVSAFWDKDDRAVLEKLLELGVSFRPEAETEVGVEIAESAE